MQETDVREQLRIEARLSSDDLQIINKRRRDHIRLGFNYQLVYVRIFNQFPKQQPFEAIDDIVLFIGLQLNISPDAIIEYSTRRETLSEHQDIIRDYLQLRRFADVQPETFRKFLFDEACRLEQTHALLARFKEHLKQQLILDPADYTLERRSLARYASRCTATRLRELTQDHRYAVLMCFLRQLYHSTVDDLVLMYDQLQLTVRLK